MRGRRVLPTQTGPSRRALAQRDRVRRRALLQHDIAECSTLDQNHFDLGLGLFDASSVVLARRLSTQQVLHPGRAALSGIALALDVRVRLLVLIVLMVLDVA